MKRFAYAAAAVVLTGVLVVLAMAVAQRDARVSDASAIENELPYANQTAKPLSRSYDEGLGLDNATPEEWPPAPIVRGNDSPIPTSFPIENDSSTRGPSRVNQASYNSADNNFPQGAAPTANDAPNNIRNNMPAGRYAEPPPLNALPGANAFNSMLTSNQSGSDASQRNSPSLGAPSANFPNSAPNAIPSTLPRASSTISDFPGNQPLPPPSTLSGPSSLPSPEPSLPSLTSTPATAPPAMPSPSYAPLPGTTPSQEFASTRNLPPAEATLPPQSFPSSFPASNPKDIGPRVPANLPPVSQPEQPPTARLGMPMANNLPSTTYASQADDIAPNLSNASLSNAAPAPQRQFGFSSAAPGTRQLDGAQNPSMEIRKRAPSEVQVGIPATFTVLVRNVGSATAFDVNVFDAVPKGAKLIRTSPQAQQNGANLSWKLGEMPAGAEQTITIELEPMTEGEIGSVASVNFAAQASVRTMSTQPKLIVKQVLENVVLGGDNLKILIDVSNAGTGTARNVRLEEAVPQNMRHSSGAKVLELSVGDLAPGESQKFDIELTAVSAGKVSNILRAVGENAAANESSATIEVISPKLQIGLEGPKLRYLERQATYTASITNTGTAVANEVYMTVFLPKGLHFNSAENEGVYIQDQHAVKWLLTELAAGKTASTKLTLLPVEEGDCILRMQANSESVRADAIEKPVRVEGQSELAFSIEDDNDPIETDGKTTYVVKIVNTGTRVDNDIQLSLDLPDGVTVEQIDAPVNYQVASKSVVFAPIAQMKSKDLQTIRIVVRHTREGTHVVRAQLKSKLRPGAVIKEESTQVYRDQ